MTSMGQTQLLLSLGSKFGPIQLLCLKLETSVQPLKALVKLLNLGRTPGTLVAQFCLVGHLINSPLSHPPLFGESCPLPAKDERADMSHQRWDMLNHRFKKVGKENMRGYIVVHFSRGI